MARSITREALQAGMAAAAVLSSACAGDGARVEFLSLGTAGTGGIYYPIGGALASRLSLRDPLRQYTAEVTGGSVENINRLRNGEMELAFALPVTIWQAYHGGEAFPEPLADLRILAPLYDSPATGCAQRTIGCCAPGLSKNGVWPPPRECDASIAERTAPIVINPRVRRCAPCARRSWGGDFSRTRRCPRNRHC